MSEPAYRRRKRPHICQTCGVGYETGANNSKHCPECSRKRNLQSNANWRERNSDYYRAKRKAEYHADVEQTRAGRRAKYARNREAMQEYHRQWRRDNRDKLALQRKCRQYGLTIDQLLGLFDEQNGLCPICLLSISVEERFDIDHCHDTGKVRGVLHSLCNIGMGFLSDDPDRCQRAADYLRRHRVSADKAS